METYTKIVFKKQQLTFDLEKILDYDDLNITSNYDEKLGYSIEVNDSSYFYDYEPDRDFDMQLLINVTQ
jgi:hypothetical protein